ncbi:MAG TPA: hypothetical protein VMG59_10885 [Phycisphaerae bacterium]|nr:hypothetical protein [Phycisphaerae bacterium]
MDDTFTMRVRAAAAATWWTVLVGVVFVLMIWVVYLALISNSNPPAWFVPLTGIGHGISWPDLQHVSLWFVCCFKFFVYMLIFAAIWLTLWGRQLKKRTSAS